MIGSNDMESGILGGYVDFIRRVHPNAPIPGVYLCRRSVPRRGEFCASRWAMAHSSTQLTEDSSTDSEFGDRSTGSGTPTDSRRRSSSPPGSEERSQLISVLIGKISSAHTIPRLGAHRPKLFLSLDKGLSVLSKACRWPWLRRIDSVFSTSWSFGSQATRADLKFVHQEGQENSRSWSRRKLPDRPIPVISFVGPAAGT